MKTTPNTMVKKRPRRRVTLVHVAEQSGVSVSVASQILSGSTSGTTRYSETTADRVRRAAKSMHYRKSLAVQMLQEGRTRILGIILPSTSHAYTAMLLTGAIEAAEERGYQILATTAGLHGATHQERISAQLNRDVDGLLMFGSEELRQSDIYGELLESHRPVVIIEHDLAEPRFDFVGMDDMASYRLAVEHLKQLGHERIGLFYESELSVPSANQRRIDFEHVIDEFDLPVLPRCYAQVQSAPSPEIDETLNRICRDRRGITALVIRGHNRSQYIYHRLVGLGIRVPQDLSIISLTARQYNDARICFDSINNPIGAIGSQAVGQLIARVEDSDQSPKHLLLPGKLIVGETCARHVASC